VDVFSVLIDCFRSWQSKTFIVIFHLVGLSTVIVTHLADLRSVVVFHLLDLLSELQIFLVLSLLLIFQLLIQFFNMILKLILITCVAHVVLINLSGKLSDVGVKFYSFNFRVSVISIMVLSIIFMVIYHRSFSIKSKNGGLKSLVFNFKIRYFHHGLVKLLLGQKFAISLILTAHIVYRLFPWAV